MDFLPELTCLQGLKGWFSFLVNDCSVDQYNGFLDQHCGF
uniref:Uncharacterized protein n=1 Tax=Arundo donax TaxID=35708 RepID=A0A0A9SII6_ARUDO